MNYFEQENEAWDLMHKIHVRIRELAAEHGVTILPLQDEMIVEGPDDNVKAFTVDFEKLFDELH